MGIAMRDILKRAGSEQIISSLSGKPKRFTDIIHQLHLPPSTLSRRIEEMIKQGIIEREYDATERTEKYKLTEKGQRYLKLVKFIYEARKFFDSEDFEEKTKQAILYLKSKKREDRQEIMKEILSQLISKELKTQVSEDKIKKITGHLINQLLEKRKEERELIYR